MRSGASRLGLAALLLVGLWIVTYWLWPAPNMPDAAPISFDDAAPRFDAGPSETGSGSVVDPLTAPGEGGTGDGGARVLEEPVVDAEPRGEEAQPPEPTEPFLVPPEFKEYVVERGDTIGSIARKVYGDEGLAIVVAQANPLTDVARLRAGQRIRVPVDPENIQGRMFDPKTGKFLPVERDAALPGRVTEYIVEKNDTLGGIAKAIYGRASLWPLILDANQHAIKSADDIRPGMRLIIPPPPQGATR